MNTFLELTFDGGDILCPYCRTVFGVKWNTEYGDPMIGTQKIECLCCSRAFYLETEIKYKVLIAES